MKSIIVSMTVAAGLMVAGSAMAAEMSPLAKKNNCVTCHTMDKKLVGPSFTDIAKKYKGATTYTFEGKEYPLVEGLMMKVSKGGKGNWGAVAMIPNDPAGKKQDDIKQLVEFVLGLAN